jgi:hypothetical protein
MLRIYTVHMERMDPCLFTVHRPGESIDLNDKGVIYVSLDSSPFMEIEPSQSKLKKYETQDFSQNSTAKVLSEMIQT